MPRTSVTAKPWPGTAPEPGGICANLCYRSENQGLIPITGVPSELGLGMREYPCNFPTGPSSNFRTAHSVSTR